MTNETLLLRQVNPSWIQNGRITSQVFRPTPKDQSRLSVYDGDKIRPKESWEHFTVTLGCRSVGVMAVTVLECANYGLVALSDPSEFPEHAVIDFGGLEENRVKTTSKLLKAAAEARGWLHRPDNAV